MRQNAVTDTLYPVQDLWNGSVLHEYCLYPIPDPIPAGNNIFAWILIGMIILALLCRNNLDKFRVWLVNFIYSPDQRNFSDMNLSGIFFPVVYLIFVPVASFMVYGMQLADTGYMTVLCVLSGYFVARFLILAGIRYVTGENALAASLMKLLTVFFALVSVCATVIYAACMFFPEIFPDPVMKVALVTGGTIFFMYLIQLFRIFFSFGEPLFLSILYLCTLEILPVCLAIGMIIDF